jgi:hypothetical protein
MTEPPNLDDLRAAALRRIDAAERNFKLGVVAFAVLEALFGGAFLVLMDFHDRLHWLLLLAAVLTYSTVAAAVFTVGAYIRTSTQGIVNAILHERQKP